MCGVTAIFYRDGRTVEASLLQKMTDRLSHRGPDGQGIWCEGPVGLGHRRLAIRDLTSAGRQPITDTAGQVVVSYNGEIYNDRELRATLGRDFGITFRSRCDTEILPAGWIAWGKGLFDRLEGMFAIALWDRRDSRLVLARDGIGIKPLYYALTPKAIRVGSEIKALLADPEQERRPDPLGVHRLLAMGHPGPDMTTLAGIHQVPPGTVLTFTANKQTQHRFWEPQRNSQIRSLGEAAEAFLALWPRVAQDQIISDVPVAVLQSGGTDSTLVSLAAGSVACTPPPLFTARFVQQSFDESAAARQVANHIHAPFHPVDIEVKEGAGEILRQVVQAYDGQVADEASVPLFLLAKAVRPQATVALSGDGGDEFFAGYPTYTASRVAACVGGLLSSLGWCQLGSFLSSLGAGNEDRLPASQKLARLASGIGDGGPHYAHAYWRRLIPAAMLPELYGPALRHLLQVDPFAGYRAALGDATSGLRLVDRCLLADQRYHLPGGLLRKTDAMSMAHGLEVRVPFLDRRIMELAGQVDPKVLAGWPGRNSKPVLRAALRRLGGPASILRAPKRGFNAPVARLLRTDIRALADSQLHQKADSLSPWLDPSAVRRLWQEHQLIKANHGYTLWVILHLSLWLDQMEQSG